MTDKTYPEVEYDGQPWRVREDEHGAILECGDWHDNWEPVDIKFCSVDLAAVYLSDRVIEYHHPECVRRPAAWGSHFSL